jgi:tetratricopeptide (TPR) repeat protein
MSSEPETIQERIQQADSLKNEGDYDRAIVAFRAILEVDPHLAEAHLGLGLSYLFMGMFDESIEELKLAVECQPQSAEGRLHLAKTYTMLGMFDEARAEFEQVLSLADPAGPVHAEAKKQLSFFG